MTKQKKPENPRDCWRTPRWIVRAMAVWVLRLVVRAPSKRRVR